MSQTEFFTEPATILRMPSWLGRDVHEDRELPLAPGDYKVTPGERWTVISLKANEVVYDGIGPVEIRRADVGQVWLGAPTRPKPSAGPLLANHRKIWER